MASRITPSRLLVVCWSLISAVSLAVPALDTLKGCEADQDSCPVSLLQTSLDVPGHSLTWSQNGRDPVPDPQSWEGQSWSMPTKSPALHAAEVVGTAAAILDGDPLRCLEASCTYGIFLTEEMRHDGRAKGHDTQIALYNFWGLDQTLQAGQITVGDLEAIHPVGDNTSFFELKGDVLESVIKAMLEEHGPPGEGGSAGSWLQMAGLRFQATWLPDFDENGEGIVQKIMNTVVDGVVIDDGTVKTVDKTYQSTGAWTLRNVWVDLDEGKWAPLDPKKTYSVVSNHRVRFGMNMKQQTIPDEAKEIDDVGSGIAQLIAFVFLNRSPVSPPLMDDRQLLAESVEILGTSWDPIDVNGCGADPCAYGALACEEFRRVGRELGHYTNIAFYSGALFHELTENSTNESIAVAKAVAKEVGATIGGVTVASVSEQITMEDMFQVHPDGHLLNFFWLSGTTIRQILQGMLDDHGPPGPGKKDSWLQTAGLRFEATWDSDRKEWVLGIVEADLANGAWQPVENDLDYSVAADAYLLVDDQYEFVARNAVLQREGGEGWGPAIVAVMSGIFRTQSPVASVVMNDNVCLSGNCSWLLGTGAAKDASDDGAAEEPQTYVETLWWGFGKWWNVTAGVEATTGTAYSEEEQAGQHQPRTMAIHLPILWVMLGVPCLLLCLCICCCYHITRKE